MVAREMLRLFDLTPRLTFLGFVALLDDCVEVCLQRPREV